MEVENKQEKTDETTAACASAPAAAKKKKSVKEVLLFFLVSAGTGLIGIGTFTLLSKLNPFVQDAGIAFDLWLFFSEMLSVVLTCTFSFCSTSVILSVSGASREGCCFICFITRSPLRSEES